MKYLLALLTLCSCLTARAQSWFHALPIVRPADFAWVPSEFLWYGPGGIGVAPIGGAIQSNQLNSCIFSNGKNGVNWKMYCQIAGGFSGYVTNWTNWTWSMGLDFTRPPYSTAVGTTLLNVPPGAQAHVWSGSSTASNSVYEFVQVYLTTGITAVQDFNWWSTRLTSNVGQQYDEATSLSTGTAFQELADHELTALPNVGAINGANFEFIKSGTGIHVGGTNYYPANTMMFRTSTVVLSNYAVSYIYGNNTNSPPWSMNCSSPVSAFAYNSSNYLWADLSILANYDTQLPMTQFQPWDSNFHQDATLGGSNTMRLFAMSFGTSNISYSPVGNGL